MSKREVLRWAVLFFIHVSQMPLVAVKIEPATAAQAHPLTFLLPNQN
jgi:hypothetical protein